MTTPHMHAAVIKEWADGKQIQFKNVSGVWETTSAPYWDCRKEYRVKPETFIPLTLMTSSELLEIARVKGFVGVAEAAVRNFIESGQLEYYLKVRDGE